MRKILSIFMFMSLFLIASPLNHYVYAAESQFQPITVTGFNADLIADNTDGNSASTSTSVSFDAYTYGANNVMYSVEFRGPQNTSSAPPYGLPSDRVINSSQNSGVSYKLAAYNTDNALFLTNQNETGTLTLETSGAYEKIIVLASSASGASDFDVTLNFSDGTNEATSFTAPDWYNGSGYAIKGIGRVARTGTYATGGVDGEFTGTSDNPRLYDCFIDNSTNKTKLLTSISVKKTSTTGRTAILAVAGQKSAGAPSTPVATSGSAIQGSSFNANWDVVAGATSYNLDVATDSNFTNLITGYNNVDTSNVTSYAVTGLDKNCTYYYRVRAVNANGVSFSSNSSIVTTISNDATIVSVLSQAITVGSEAGTSGDPKTASINVTNNVSTVMAADIVKHDTTATVTFYGTDGSFGTVENSSVDLAVGAGTAVYIKVTAEDGTEIYYKITINRISPPNVTAGVVNRTSDTTGTVKFTSDKAGQYYYAIVNDGATAPTIDTSGVGTACTTAETTITNPSGLTAGAKDFYIKVKDAVGNVSSAIKIDIAAYVAPDTLAPNLSAGAVSRSSDTAGTVKFTSDEAGSYYYEVVADGATAPTIDTSGVGTACTTAESTITSPIGLTAGVKDIYILVKDDAGNVSSALKMDIPAYIPPSNGAGSGGATNDNGTNNSEDSTSTDEKITVDVKNGETDNTVSKIIIERTTDSTGQKKDTISYGTDKARETVQELNSNGDTTARIVIPDNSDKVVETRINIPTDSIRTLADGSVNLQIDTQGAKINLAETTLKSITADSKDDLYFRLVPVKDEVQKETVNNSALIEAIKIAGDDNSTASIIGDPITIETNLKSINADITLPLTGVIIPSDHVKKAELLKQLAVYIAHSDGEKELVQGELVEYSDSVYGIRFHINKFSTFTVVKTDAFLKSSDCNLTKVIVPSSATISGKTITVSVANSIKGFTANVSVSDKATWKLYEDKTCTMEVKDNKVSLVAGKNVYYVKVTAEDGITSKTFSLIINRDKPQLQMGFNPLRLRAEGGTTSQKLNYTKVSEADGYVIYGAPCGLDNQLIKIADVSANSLSYTVKGLKSDTYYKYVVKAYQVINGKKVIVAKSKMVHSTTTSKKNANPTMITVISTKVSLNTGVVKQIISKLVLPKGMKSDQHTAEITYESTNKSVATVNSDGKITAIAKGTCNIYAYAQNGVYTKIKVTVN